MKRIAIIGALTVAAPAAIGCGDNTADPGITVAVVVMPDRQWYHTDEPVMVVGFPTDAGGQLVADLPLVWSVDPPEAASDGDDDVADPLSRNFVLRDLGPVTFTACRARREGGLFPGGPCGSITLQVDDGSPALELNAPLPGDELDGPDGIVVRGSVTDAGEKRVFVDGALVDTDELGQFETTVAAEFGVNHLDVVASDGITEESAIELDVVWAPGYAPALGAGGTPDIAVDNAIALSVGQRVFDDRQPLDTGVTPIVLRDLADVVELVAGRLPVVDQIPDPVLDQPSIFLRIPAADVGPATASIDVTPEGLDLFLQLSAFELTTQGFLSVDGETLDLAGTVAAEVAVSAAIRLGRASPEDPIEVEITGLSVALESIGGEFVSAETAAIFQIAGGLLRTTIEDRLRDALEDSVAASVPELLRGVLEGLDTRLAGIELVLDAEILPDPITLTLDGGLRTAVPRNGQDLLATLGIRIGTTTSAHHPQSRGVALFEPTDAEDPGLFRDRELQLGVRLTLLNAALHALWNSCLLEIDLSGRVPGVIDSGLLSGKLAPVVRPARAGDPAEAQDQFVLSVGQVELTLSSEGAPAARFGVSIDAPIGIDIASDAIAIDASAEPRIRVWVIEGGESTVFTEELIRGFLLDQWPSLVEPIVGGLSFDLPVVTLSGLGDIVPELADVTLSLQPSATVAFRRGHVLLEAALRGAFAE